jgi:cellulose synthase operon protein C
VMPFLVEQVARPATSAVSPTDAGRTAGVASKTARSTAWAFRLSCLFLFTLSLSAQTLDTCREAHHRGRLQEESACYQKLAASPDPYIRAEADWALRRFKEANDAGFREAVKAQPKNAGYRVRWGRMLLERAQPQDAQDLFLEALEIKDDHAGAILGLALLASEGFEGKAAELAQKALEADPKLVEARVLLATIALEDNDPGTAAEQAQKALVLDPESLEAMAILAAIDWLEDKPDTPYLARIQKINPVYGEVYATAGRFFVLNRRYDEAIRLYRKALELSPALWKARAELGLNLMRMGQEAEAKAQLEQCFNAGDTYPAVGNPLRLLESYKNFKYIQNGNVTLKLHEREVDLLQPYVAAETKRAIATYEAKYKMRLDHPVQVEVYPDHEDFAVRVLGMPGMGALGVTFGYTVAMDSPNSRKPGEFHWASTEWHELSHVFTLAATNSRVPRWFTEGMAVYEETAASPEWGDRLNPPVILAIREKKLLPVAQLDRGFVHPTSPDQVIVSYYQAGKICNFIEGKWGYQKLLDMLHAFGKRMDTPEVIQQQLGMKPEEFDKLFFAWVEAATRKTVVGFDEWKKGMQHIAELLKGEKNDDVIREAPAIRDLYPEYVEAGSVYEVLADAYLAKKDEKSAANELERYARAGGRNPESLKKLATLLEAQGRPKEAIEALSRLNFIYPRDEELHRRLGDLLLAQANAADAIREFRAVLAMKPLDQAAAHYNLARAYSSANRAAEAIDEVLLSLEAAPGYRPAQRLLLKLNPSESGPQKN